MERQIRGIPASPGIVVGLAHLLRWEVPDVRHRIIPDEQIHDEIAQCAEALKRFFHEMGAERRKSIDFSDELPREPTGKLLKRQLRDPYWEGRDRAI
mgnify:CR=1 FL=1